MSHEIHTFIIDIPPELQLTEEERSELEGLFQVDAGHLLDRRAGPDPPPFTNVQAVRVVTRLRAESLNPPGGGTPGGGGTSKKGSSNKETSKKGSSKKGSSKKGSSKK